MKLLFVTSTRIGDAVLSTGLLDQLRRDHEGVRITVACGHLPAPLFRMLPGVERVIELRKRAFGLHWLGLWCATVFHFWDLVIDLRGSALGWLLPARSRRVSRRAHGSEHRVETLARVLELSEPPSPKLITDENARAAAGKLIPDGGPVIGLGVTANWLPKIWPGDRFVALAERLTAVDGPFAGARIAVFGGPGEEALAAPVTAALGDDAIDLVGKAGIAETAACLERCAIFVGNDSGLMHMAAALDRPTVGLFGPSPPAHYGPWGAHCRLVAGDISYEEIVGDPEFDHRKTENLMTGLSVDAVFDAVREMASGNADTAG